jgi:hypothetical protein
MEHDTIMQVSFDYLKLAGEDRGFVRERAARIRELSKRTAEAIALIGQWLTEVKDRLPHGSWLPWLEHEFGWNERTAQRLIGVYRSFKSDNLSDLDIDVSALYLIAAPKTPEPVRQEIIRRAQAGERMTRAEAVKALDHYEKTTDAQQPDPDPALVEEPDSPSPDYQRDIENEAFAQAAELIGLSESENERYLRAAMKLKQEDPEKYERVRRGEIELFPLEQIRKLWLQLTPDERVTFAEEILVFRRGDINEIPQI